MKQFLVPFFCIGLFFGSCSNNDAININLSTNYANDTILVNKNKTFQIIVTNRSMDRATIAWDYNENLIGPATWTQQINGTLNKSGHFELDATASDTLSLRINPQGTHGTSGGTIDFYDALDKAATIKTFTYILTAQ